MTSPSGAASRAAAGAASAVDRYLCSYVHLSPAFARYVLAEFTQPSLRATDLAFGVDLIALVRHAQVSYRRTVSLRVVLTADLVLLSGSVLSLLGIGTSGASGIAATAAVAAVAVGVLTPYLAVMTYLIGAHGYAQRMNAKNADARSCAPALDPGLEQRLAELMECNTVVFQGGYPFGGYGLPLGSWKIEVDTSKAATDSSGQPRAVTPFDAVELHKELTRAVRQAGIPDLRVHNRLFVAGVAVGAVPTLLPDPQDRPAARVGPNAVRLGITRPRPDARTYLCVEKISWNGELVINLLVRAAMLAGDLFIEGHAFVLLPIRSEMCPLDRVARSRGEVLWYAVRDTARTTWSHTVNSPLHLLRLWRHRLRRSRAVAADRRRIQRGQVFDRGAAIGIRRLAADTERMYLFAYTDEEMILNSIRRRVLGGIEAFLDRHGVDVSQFVQAQSNIVNNNYSIQNALANAMNIGPGGSVNTFGTTPASPPSATNVPGGATPNQPGATPPGPVQLPWTNTP